MLLILFQITRSRDLSFILPLWLNVFIPFVIEQSLKDGKLASFVVYNKTHWAQGWMIGNEN